MTPKVCAISLVAAVSSLSLGCDRTAKDECGKAGSALATFLAAAPKACTADADCATFYVRPDPCAPPVVAAKTAFSGAREPALLERQAAVTKACGVPSQPLCDRITVRTSCRAGACVAVP